MQCLGIESTAHTFGASIVEDAGRIITNANSTYRPPVGAGIHPRKASEHHAEVSNEILKMALTSPEGNSLDPDIIAYSMGPGLGPCLRIGATVARALAAYLEKPLVPVHHGVAHLDIAMSLAEVRDPLAILVSGGHTSLLVHLARRWRVYGETQDITLGNLLDMFAREAELPSPGGPTIEKLAKKGHRLLKLPYTAKGNDVAYSGLLTAAIQLLKNDADLEDLCFSLQEIAFSMLAEAVERTLVQTRKPEVVLAGGVAANSRLKEMLESVSNDHSATYNSIPIKYSGDCGAQIAFSGGLAYKHGVKVANGDSRVIPRWRMDEVDVPWVPRN